MNGFQTGGGKRAETRYPRDSNLLTWSDCADICTSREREGKCTIGEEKKAHRELTERRGGRIRIQSSEREPNGKSEREEGKNKQ